MDVLQAQPLKTMSGGAAAATRRGEEVKAVEIGEGDNRLQRVKSGFLLGRFP